MAVNLKLLPFFVSSAMRARANQRDCRYCREGLEENEANIKLQNGVVESSFCFGAIN